MFLLREIYEKANYTVILLSILTVIYIVGLVGYYKMIMRSSEMNGVRGEKLVIIFTLLASIIWPLVILWSLVVEASR